MKKTRFTVLFVLLALLATLLPGDALAATDKLDVLGDWKQDKQDTQVLTFTVKMPSVKDANDAVKNPGALKLIATVDKKEYTSDAESVTKLKDSDVTFYYTVLFQMNMKWDMQGNQKTWPPTSVKDAFETLPKKGGNAQYRFLYYDSTNLWTTKGANTNYRPGFSSNFDDKIYNYENQRHKGIANPLNTAALEAAQDSVSKTGSKANAQHVMIIVTENTVSPGSEDLISYCTKNNILIYVLINGAAPESILSTPTGGASYATSLSEIGTELDKISDDLGALVLVNVKPKYEVMNADSSSVVLSYNGAKSEAITIKNLVKASTTPEATPTPNVTPTPKATIPPKTKTVNYYFTDSGVKVYKDRVETSENGNLITTTIDGQTWNVFEIEDTKNADSWAHVRNGKTEGWVLYKDIILKEPTPTPTAAPTSTPIKQAATTAPITTVPPTGKPTPSVEVMGKQEAEAGQSTPAPKSGFFDNIYKKVSDKFGEKNAKWLLMAAGLFLLALIAVIIILIAGMKKKKKRAPSHNSGSNSLRESSFNSGSFVGTSGDPAGETIYMNDNGSGYEPTSGTVTGTKYDKNGTVDPFMAGGDAGFVSNYDSADEKTVSGKMDNPDLEATVRDEKRGVKVTFKWEFDDKSDTFEAYIVSSVTVGRGRDNKVVVPEKSVSRKHATILMEPDGLYIRDEGSTYGTTVNGAKVTDKTPIKSGDVLMLGDSKLTLTIGE